MNLADWKNEIVRSPGYAWLADDNYVVIAVSADLEKLLGINNLAPDQSDIFGQANQNSWTLALAQAESKGHSVLEVDLSADKENKQYLNFDIFQKRDSEQVFYIGRGLDVTTYKMREKVAASTVRKLEDRLESSVRDLALARDRAMAASRARSGFLANMSHELRTPLNAIIGYSEILQEDLLGNEQCETDLKRIHNAGKHLLSLINDILDLSKIEAGKMGLSLEYFQIDAMLNEVVDTIRRLAQSNEIQLDLVLDENLGVALSDVTKVRQILLNLISNSIKHSNADKIVLRASREKSLNRDSIVFVVEDNGPGMSSEEQKQIFEEFFREENDASKKLAGASLGLVLCQRFAQILGGSLDVQSEEGKGARYIVTIPVNSAKLHTNQIGMELSLGPKVDPKNVRFSGNNPGVERRKVISKILVIDDDPSVRDLMERYLTREGFDVKAVASGQEGISILSSYKPHIITLDVLMPVMDGWTVLSELKRNPETQNIPVIMVSMMDELDLSFALGAADYLIKPIQKDVLMETVVKHLRGGSESKVLVVDDKPENRSIIARTLSVQGIRILEAANGLEALDTLEKETPDLILLDLLMPEMDGFRFSEEVSRHPKWKDIPIVVLTSKDLSADEIKRLSGKVEKVYERRDMDLESFLFDIQSMVARKLRKQE
ncbi:MAG: response regulator [Gammaproteobacteria bacterium]|nr:response regulator [Gammaproteobacteria bacterium]